MRKSQFLFVLMLSTSFATMARADDTSLANCVAAGEGNCVQIGTSGTYYALSGPEGNKTMTIYGPTESGSTAATVPQEAFFFWDDENEMSTVPAGVTSLKTSGNVNIGEYAFNGATGLTSVDLTGVKTIGSGAFWGATGLTSVDLTGVQTIGGGAFSSTGLSSVVIGGTPEIGGYAFDNLPSGAKLYCESESVCQTIISTSEREVNDDLISLSECDDIVIQTFSKGDDGVYVLKDEDGDPIAYYSSAANMMAGGTQEGCATQESCAAVVLAANNPTPQPTKPQRADIRIYTIDEANAVAGKTNIFSIRYR